MDHGAQGKRQQLLPAALPSTNHPPSRVLSSSLLEQNTKAIASNTTAHNASDNWRSLQRLEPRMVGAKGEIKVLVSRRSYVLVLRKTHR